MSEKRMACFVKKKQQTSKTCTTLDKIVSFFSGAGGVRGVEVPSAKDIRVQRYDIDAQVRIMCKPSFSWLVK